ncbi:MAG: hypothetical protein ACYCYK_12485 [Candidatus Dormibacteria bacterium]
MFNEYSFNVFLNDLVYQNNSSRYWINFVFLEDLFVNETLNDFVYVILNNIITYYVYYFFIIDFLLDGLEDLDELFEEIYNSEERHDSSKKFDEFLNFKQVGYNNYDIFEDNGTFNIISLSDDFLEKDFDDDDEDLIT